MTHTIEPEIASFTQLVIEGGRSLSGNISIGGAKNAALPCMAASLLSSDDCIIRNVPDIGDVAILADVLRHLGVTVERREPGVYRLNAGRVKSFAAPVDIVKKMRASFLVMGPLLARFGEASSCAPGGDVIGQRPIDVHLVGFAALGARIELDGEVYTAWGARLVGNDIFLDYPSHIGTENILMAATLSEGTTTILNASAEPEVKCLADMLNAMGAQIDGAGTNRIVVRGVTELHGVEHAVIPDRIEAGTYAMACAITGGNVRLEGVVPGHLDSLLWKFRECGITVDVGPESLEIACDGPLTAVHVQALPYPGFPTDLQSAIGVMLTQAEGKSIIHERVYDNRLLYVHELVKMGAEIDVAGQTAIVNGPRRLHGCTVHALDIRSGAALVLGGLVADGRTNVRDVFHLDRGYEKVDEKLRSLGASISRQ